MVIDVFFQGWGQWFFDDGDIDFPVSLLSTACGVFSLTESDSIAYWHSRSLNGVNVLLPCKNHPHSAFYRSFKNDDCAIECIDSHYFRIDYEKNVTLCIASEYPEAKNGVLNLTEFGLKPLIKEPDRKDAWYEAISDMVKDFYSDNKKLPNKYQAWAQLWTEPPVGYRITTGKEKGEDILFMPGESPLSQSSFVKRWNKYTE